MPICDRKYESTCLKVGKLHNFSFLESKNLVFIRNCVNHRPIHDKKYENPCLEV